MSALSSVLLLCCLSVSVLCIPQGRIVGGRDAMEGQLPYQVSVRKNDGHICGGAIISSIHILTAAHCVSDFVNGILEPNDVQQFTILAGTTNCLNGGVIRQVASFIMHEAYAEDLSDVAILTLSEPLPFSRTIAAVPLASAETPAGAQVTVSGWGRVATNGNTPVILQWNVLTALSHGECADGIGAAMKNIMCLGHSRNNGACYGDSGGPAVYKGELVGVAGFVVNGCGSSNPDGYAKVFFHIDWIRKHIAAY